TCSSSGTSRIPAATSAGGHSRNTSRSAPKLRASIMLLISGSKILPTISGVFVRDCRRVLAPPLAQRNQPLSFLRSRGISYYYLFCDGAAASVGNCAKEVKSESNAGDCIQLDDST